MSVVRPVGVQPQAINPYNFKKNPRRIVQTSGFETQEKPQRENVWTSAAGCPYAQFY